MGIPIPQDFWYRPNVANHLSRFDLPAVLAALTTEGGWTQADLAHRLGYSQSSLSKIINRIRPLRVDAALQLIRDLAIPRHLIGVGPEDSEEESLDRRQFTQMAATTIASAALPRAGIAASNIRQTTKRFATLERKHGGNAVRQVLTRKIAVLAPIVRTRGGPGALAAFGELCGLAGYAYYDSQALGLADHYYSVALQAAHESGTQILAAQVRALMSMRATWVDQAHEGAAHCTAALSTYRRLPPLERAMLMGRQARAEALKGNHQMVHRLIGMSREILSAAGTRQPLIAYWSPTEIYGNAGIAYRKIGAANRAEPELRTAIAAADTGDARDATLYLGILSRLLLKEKRYEEAVQSIEEIMSMAVMSSRTTWQLRLFLAKTRMLSARPLIEARHRIQARLDYRD